VEDWTISNQSGEAHAFHIHQIHFLVTAINGMALTNPYMADTITVPSWGGRDPYPNVTVRMDFPRSEYCGFICVPLPHSRPRGRRHDGNDCRNPLARLNGGGTSCCTAAHGSYFLRTRSTFWALTLAAIVLISHDEGLSPLGSLRDSLMEFHRSGLSIAVHVPTDWSSEADSLTLVGLGIVGLAGYSPQYRALVTCAQGRGLSVLCGHICKMRVSQQIRTGAGAGN
jgi:hypothetical protein